MRFRSSVLVKSVVVVVLALLLSMLLTTLTFSRLTRSSLAEQSSQLGRSQMSILQEVYNARERHLISNLRNLTQMLQTQGMFADAARAGLIAEMGRAAANLEIDMLAVFDARGRPLAPAASVGTPIADPEALPGMVHDGLRSRLVRAPDGSFLQVIIVSVSVGRDELLVVGGYSFDDEFAYSLRKQVGSHDDVLLVASGRVVGSTLPLPPSRPPAPDDAGELPTSPVELDREDFSGIISYVLLGRTVDAERAAIGLVFTDPTALLEGSLGQARLVATLVLALVTLGLGVLLYRHLIRPLVRLAGTAREIAGGDLDLSFQAKGQDEIGMLASSLEQMRVELRTKLDLIARQATDLRRQTTELQQSSQRIVAAEDNERHRLARDLHDGIQQELVVLRMRIGMAAESASQAGGAMAGEFEQLGADLDAAIERMREVTRNLYPSILLDRGLAVATRSYIRRLPLNVRLTYASEPFPRLHPAIESGAYFLLCEALTNSFKHAESREICISLTVEGEWLTVTVQDDGRGFRPEEVRGTGGLLHMHDRVRSFGGCLEIVSAPGEGTTIRARFPTRLPEGDVALPESPDGMLSPPAAPERTGLPRPAG